MTAITVSMSILTVTLTLLLLLLPAPNCLAAPSPEPAPEPQLYSSYNPSFIANPAIYTYTVDNNNNNNNNQNRNAQSPQFTPWTTVSKAKQREQKQQPPSPQQQNRDNDVDYSSNNNNNNNNYIDYARYRYNSNNNSSSAFNRNIYYTNKFNGAAGGTTVTSTSSTTSVTPTQPFPVSGCQLDRLAVYKVVLHTYWTRDLFPKHYPDWRPTAQWTKTIGIPEGLSKEQLAQYASRIGQKFADVMNLADSIIDELVVLEQSDEITAEKRKNVRKYLRVIREQRSQCDTLHEQGRLKDLLSKVHQILDKMVQWKEYDLQLDESATNIGSKQL